MRARVLVAAVGIPAYALFMAFTAPASFIASRLNAATDGRVHFTDTTGTLWQGSMRAHIDGATLDSIAWHFLPSSLANGRIAFDITLDAPDIAGKARLSRGWSQWEADSDAMLEARALPAFLPLVAAWRPEGRVEVKAERLRWDDREMHGTVTGEWRNAAISLSEVKPLGTYRLVATGKGETASLELATIAGPLEVNGKGEAKLPNGGVTFSGDARAEGTLARQLEPLLNLMGPKRPDGARSIEVRIR